jgi:hypothetical protein
MPSRGSHQERKAPLHIHRNRKIRMLKDEFYLKLTPAEIDRFYTLDTHTEIDAYAHDLIKKKL